eukprot:6182604-Pleurochrysis_carterae.AAC.4
MSASQTASPDVQTRLRTYEQVAAGSHTRDKRSSTSKHERTHAHACTHTHASTHARAWAHALTMDGAFVVPVVRARSRAGNP